MVELRGRSLAGLQCQLVHLQIDSLPSFTSKFFLYLSHCLSYAVFLSSPPSLCLSLSDYHSLSFSFCFSAHLLTYGERTVLTYLQICSSLATPDSLLFLVPNRMQHSPKICTLNLTDIFRPALIFHSVQLRHLFETVHFLI